MAQYELTDEEVQVAILAIHLAQDIYAQGADGLSKQGDLHEDDSRMMREMDKRNDLLDTVRRKLGDTWEPALEYRAPDDLSSLDDEA